MAWQQYRRVDAGALSVENLDMSIEVENPPESEHKFEVSIWNLTDESWSDVSEDDYCRIVLGWGDGVKENVIHGVIKKKFTEPDGNDRKFVIKGIDATDGLVKKRVSKSYEDTLRPDEIASSLAGEVGLTTGSVTETPSTVSTRFPVKKDKPVRHWFNELVKEAESQTGLGWAWFVDGGKFYFVQKDGTKSNAVKLSYDNTLLSINEADSDSEGEPGLVFESMMEPRIRKSSIVKVDTDKFSGKYNVVEYTFTSDTTSGDHVVEGKLAPTEVVQSTGNQGFIEGIL